MSDWVKKKNSLPIHTLTLYKLRGWHPMFIIKPTDWQFMTHQSPTDLQLPEISKNGPKQGLAQVQNLKIVQEMRLTNFENCFK